MLALTKQTPFGGELQVAVEQLAAVMIPPSSKNAKARDAARQRMREANATKLSAETDFLTACTRLGVRHGRQLPPEVIELQRRFDDAVKDLDKATKAYVLSISAEGDDYLAAQNAMIATSLPTLIEVVKLLNLAFEPLFGLHHHGITRDLPTMRIVQRSPELVSYVRAITAIMNEVSSPARSQAY